MGAVMATRNRDRHGHSWLHHDMGDEYGQVAQAERQALVWLEQLAQDPGRADSTQPPDGDHTRRKAARRSSDDHDAPKKVKRAFVPTANALSIIARLVVHLTRVRATSIQLTTLTIVDYVAGVLVVIIVTSFAGYTFSGDIADLNIFVVIGASIPSVVLFGRLTVVAASRIQGRRAIRLRELAQRRGSQFAVEDLLERELPRLLRWRRLAQRINQPILAYRITKEITSVRNLRNDLRKLSRNDLDWALHAELEHPESVPPVTYGRELTLGQLEWVVDSPRRVWLAFKTWTKRTFVPADAARILALDDAELSSEVWREMELDLHTLYNELGPPPSLRNQEYV
jgi:hypothetical protein